MGELFLQQLPQRVQIPPDPALLSYSLFVRLARLKLNMGRAELADRADVDCDFLAFLENGLVEPAELTREVRDKIESTLECPYWKFLRLNKDVVNSLGEDWLSRYWLAEEPDSAKPGTPKNLPQQGR